MTAYRTFGLLGLALLATSLSCSTASSDSADDGKLSVFAGIPPQAGLVRRIGGDRVAVHVFVPAGQDPHTFEPTPRQVAALGRAKLLLHCGMPFEQRLVERIRPTHKDLAIVDVSDGIRKRPMECSAHDDHAGHDHAHDHGHADGDACETCGSHHAGEPDPHVWLSPRLLKIQATNIATALSKADPAGAAVYQKNVDSLHAELDALDAKIGEQLKPYEGRCFYVFHAALGYFGDAYGLKQRAIELGGKQPTPKQMQALVEQARSDGAKVIFVEPQFDQRSAQAIAEVIGATTVEIDPLAADVLANLARMAEQIAAACAFGDETLTTPVAIDVRGVSFSYDRVVALEDVNFTVAKGESICLVGPNGGGKTTLLKLMLGLIRPDSGEVRIFGQSPRRARLRIGYMPQHVRYDPKFPATVTDVVRMGRLGGGGLSRLLGRYSADDRLAADEALAEVGLDKLAQRPLAALSGGQRQRVLIARALCCRPDLLLMDEPTSNVDVGGEARLMEILERLSQRMTIVMVTHDLGFVSDLVQRVVCVNRRVVIHPTAKLTGEVIQDIYDTDVRMVRHDHHFPHAHGEPSHE